ncbi:fumarylacetoacetate hydrolase family protein [Sulfobacillus harzensis]|uniref:Fumarylacetoacetate hydrolase family protein n=1 Tax=Sulfobacillus harzensis TaxID=2729629 RepID=A0A7Y0L6F0_9FIRM|nr:fumarylacetoacetate hydrolase family protein [Sulfobacillus harzensis]NMP24132.1 fumarylacetoacetate hydrolase family protein [Sulfobacillus harzensis]
MKIAAFDNWRVGVVKGSVILDITDLVPGWEPEWPFSWMLKFIERFDAIRPQIAQHLERAPRRSLSDVRLRPPIPAPSKIIAAPVNYRLHQHEMGGAKGVYQDANIKTIEHYGIFLKPPSAIVGTGETITLPFAGRRTDHEAEVGVIIGKTVKNVVESEADQAIFGITGLLDLSVRGQEDRPFRKGFDGFCPIGPVVLTRDEIPDLEHIAFHLRVNGITRQQGNTKDMIYSIRRLVSLASYQTTLHPGDIIASGTPEGVGEVKAGDRLELTVDGVGTLVTLVHESYADPPSNMGEWFNKFLISRGAPA